LESHERGDQGGRGGQGRGHRVGMSRAPMVPPAVDRYIVTAPRWMAPTAAAPALLRPPPSSPTLSTPRPAPPPSLHLRWRVTHAAYESYVFEVFIPCSTRRAAVPAPADVHTTHPLPPSETYPLCKYCVQRARPRLVDAQSGLCHDVVHRKSFMIVLL
jgi:hypothetical protein